MIIFFRLTFVFFLIARTTFAEPGIPETGSYKNCRQIFPSSEEGKDPSTIVNICEKNGMQIAVKAVRLSKQKHPNAFNNEVAILEAVKGFPNILEILDSFSEEEGWSYLITEYCAGGDLFTLIKETEGLSEIQAKKFFRTLVKTAFFLHEKKIAYLDFKLENIFFLDKARTILKLGDFDLSEDLSNKEPSGYIKGTPDNIPPEVAPIEDIMSALSKAYPGQTRKQLKARFSFANRKKKYDPYKADVFSLGAVLVQIVDGSSLYSDPDSNPNFIYFLKTPAGKAVQAYRKRDKLPPISDELEDLLNQMMEKDPTKRPTMAQVFGHRWLQETSRNDYFSDDESDEDEFAKITRQVLPTMGIAFKSCLKRFGKLIK